MDAGVEGAVLKGALAARSRARGVVQAAAVAAAFLAAALALSETVFLAVSSSLSLRDAFVLYGWLLGGSLVVALAAVLLLTLIAWRRTRGRGDVEVASTELGIAFGLVAGVGG